VNFALHKAGVYNLLWFFILLGIMDILLRIGLGLMYCTNWDAFDVITIFEPRNLERVQQEVVSAVERIA
jgi:hypothetical protein